MVIFMSGTVATKKPWQEEVMGGPVATKKQGQEKELIYKNKYRDDDVKMMEVGGGMWGGDGKHNSYNINVVKDGIELTITPKQAPEARKISDGTALVGTLKMLFDWDCELKNAEFILPHHEPIRVDFKPAKDSKLHPAVEFGMEFKNLLGTLEDTESKTKIEFSEQSIKLIEISKAKHATADHDVLVGKIYDRKGGLAKALYDLKYLSDAGDFLRLTDFVDASDETLRMNDFIKQHNIREEIEQARSKLSLNPI
ncbi:MAG: hypothetical protein NT130_05650 [Candidatus Micrarchaeota archaeon]|nr:hypothetical protein [Candidatus Micrarchaeota archaeon]